MPVTNKTEATEKLTGADACVCMHTALRKCCDSKITSAAYNLIHMINFKPDKFDPWRFFGGLVAERVNHGEKPASAVQAAIDELSDRFLDQLDSKENRALPRAELPDGALNALYALRCIFQCFSKGDITAVAAYLGDET